MKKIKIGSKYWALKFFSALIVVGILGALLMESLCALFGTAQVFYTCWVVVMIAGLILPFHQYYKNIN